MGNRIQISRDLFDAMAYYVQNHYDPMEREKYAWICNGIQMKRQNEIRHNLFSAYKTEKDPETADVLRQAYLDQSGIPSSYRWAYQCDEAIRHGEDI
jgi:hypothetical protein